MAILSLAPPALGLPAAGFEAAVAAPLAGGLAEAAEVAGAALVEAAGALVLVPPQAARRNARARRGAALRCMSGSICERLDANRLPGFESTQSRHDFGREQFQRPLGDGKSDVAELKQAVGFDTTGLTGDPVQRAGALFG